MKQAWIFFWNLLQVDVRNFLRNKAAAFWTFGFPLLSLIIFMSAFGESGKLGQVGLVFIDQDKSPASGALIQHLKLALQSQQAVEVVFAAGEKEQIELQIPAGFAERVQARQGVLLDARLQQPKSMASDVALNIIASVADDYALRQLYQYRGIQLATQAPPARAKLPYAAYLVTGLLCMVVVSTALMGFVVPLVSARQAGHFRVFELLPVSRLSVVLAFSVSKFLVIVLAGLLLFGFAALLYQPGFPLAPGPWLHALPVLLLGVAGFLALGLVLAARLRNSEWATLLCNLVYFPLIFLGNLFVPLDGAGPLKQVLDVMPVNLFVHALRACLMQGDSIWSQTLFLWEFGVLIVFSLAYASKAFVLNQGMLAAR
ncbi:ABC transporter permease [Massilia sp. W12]|uniref:ABC transporter permease n=1 Tax=Massilia sp. W12 TaxID=3126507 RepID=UPI0030D3570C